MSVSVSEETLLLLARLSRVALGPDEEKEFIQDLNRILGFMEQLNEVDVMDVPPLLQIVDQEEFEHPLAEDVEDSSGQLPRSVFLDNVPQHQHRAGLVLVPAVMQGYES